MCLIAALCRAISPLMGKVMNRTAELQGPQTYLCGNVSQTTAVIRSGGDVNAQYIRELRSAGSAGHCCSLPCLREQTLMEQIDNDL